MITKLQKEENGKTSTRNNKGTKKSLTTDPHPYLYDAKNARFVLIKVKALTLHTLIVFTHFLGEDYTLLNILI